MYFEATDQGVILFLKVTPRSSSNKVRGVESISKNKQVLKVMVTAVAEDGKANAAVLKLLSKFLKIPKTSCKIIKGETSRFKTVLITQDFEKVQKELAKLSSKDL